MCYIILPCPELIYYMQHRLYAPIGAIDNQYTSKIQNNISDNVKKSNNT